MTNTPHPIVRVTWHDAQTVDAWLPIGDVLAYAERHREIQTVGFLLQDDSDDIVVATTYENDFGKVAGSTIIPKNMVVSVEHLTPKQPARKNRSR